MAACQYVSYEAKVTEGAEVAKEIKVAKVTEERPPSRG